MVSAFHSWSWKRRLAPAKWMVVPPTALTIQAGRFGKSRAIRQVPEVVRVSSHYPFDRVNRRLEFDRAAARGTHLDIDAGSTERWAPGETRTFSELW